MDLCNALSMKGNQLNLSTRGAASMMVSCPHGAFNALISRKSTQISYILSLSLNVISAVTGQMHQASATGTWKSLRKSHLGGNGILTRGAFKRARACRADTCLAPNYTLIKWAHGELSNCWGVGWRWWVSETSVWYSNFLWSPAIFWHGFFFSSILWWLTSTTYDCNAIIQEVQKHSHTD